MRNERMKKMTKGINKNKEGRDTSNKTGINKDSCTNSRMIEETTLMDGWYCF